MNPGIVLEGGVFHGQSRDDVPQFSPVVFGTHLGDVHLYQRYDPTLMVDTKTKRRVFSFRGYAARRSSAWRFLTWLGLRAPKKIEV